VPNQIGGAGSSPPLNGKSRPSNTKAARKYNFRRQQRHHLIDAIVGLGARVVFEFIDELDRYHDLGGDLDNRLARYAGLDPALLHALDADRFPASPIRVAGAAQ